MPWRGGESGTCLCEIIRLNSGGGGGRTREIESSG